MEYEYVALTWGTHNRRADECFMADYHRLYDAGWEVSLDAPFEAEGAGGACIMRRPKDEPRKWTEGEIEEVAKRYYRRRRQNANIHLHVGSDPFCLCDECSELYRIVRNEAKEEING